MWEETWGRSRPQDGSGSCAAPRSNYREAQCTRGERAAEKTRGRRPRIPHVLGFTLVPDTLNDMRASKTGLSHCLASLGHTGRTILGHTYKMLTLTPADERRGGLCVGSAMI